MNVIKNYLQTLGQATRQFELDFKKAWDDFDIDPTYNNQGEREDLIFLTNKVLSNLLGEAHPTVYLWYNPDDDTLQELTEEEAKEAEEQITPIKFDSLDIHFIVYPY